MSRVIRGVLLSDDWLPNSERRFGAATHYLWGYYVRGDVRKAFAMTPDELDRACERAAANPEDLLPFESEAARAGRILAARSDAAPTGRLLVLASALLFFAGLLVGVWAGGWL